LTTSLATISLCFSSTAICTLYPAIVAPFFVSNRASQSVRDSCVSPLASSCASSPCACARSAISAVIFCAMSPLASQRSSFAGEDVSSAASFASSAPP